MHLHSDDSAVSEAFSRMYQRQARTLYKYCLHQTKSKEAAEDLVQETFLRAWLYMLSGRVIESATTFLRRTADHLMVDEVRKLKGQVVLSLDHLQENGVDPSYDEQERLQNALEIHAIMDTLRKKERKLLAMRYIEGLPPSDIASRTGLSANTVAARLSRLLKRLTTRKQQERISANR